MHGCYLLTINIFLITLPHRLVYWCATVTCHLLQLLLHIIINVCGYATATCAPFGIVFSWPPIPLLCMRHITTVNVPQHYNFQNTIQPHHALRLAFAFLKKCIYTAQKVRF